MLRSFGIQLSLLGAALVVFGAAGMVFLPKTGPAVAMLIGAVAVIVGFAITLAHYYTTPEPPNSRKPD